MSRHSNLLFSTQNACLKQVYLNSQLRTVYSFRHIFCLSTYFCCVFQDELLGLFPSKARVTAHREVVRFASGLSEEVGTFLSQGCFFKAGIFDPMILNLIEENELFAQDVFRKMPAQELLVNTSRVKCSKARMHSRMHSLARHAKKMTIILGEQGDLNKLFYAQEHPGFTGLETLGLCNCGEEDAICFSDFAKTGRLPHLKRLDFSKNTLTGCLRHLFGGPDHPGFPSLEKLYLSETHLNREDVESLIEAVRAGKLPKLNKLSLSHNDLSHMER